jgi:hypothetical protein
VKEATKDESHMLAVLRARGVDISTLLRALDTDDTLESGAVLVRDWSMQCPKCSSGGAWRLEEGVKSWTLNAGLLGLKDPCTCKPEWMTHRHATIPPLTKESLQDLRDELSKSGRTK